MSNEESILRTTAGIDLKRIFSLGTGDGLRVYNDLGNPALDVLDFSGWGAASMKRAAQLIAEARPEFKKQLELAYLLEQPK